MSTSTIENPTSPSPVLKENTTPPIPPFTFSEEQSIAIDRIMAWADPLSHTPTREFKLGGYAGTGKTTIIKEIIKRFNSLGLVVNLAAFTGKACNVLQRKGLSQAQTLHSLLYFTEVNTRTGEYTFHKRITLESSPDILIVDEASMISTDLYHDMLLHTKLRFLFVGDPGQLEPVGDNPELMKSPHFTLSKIHRQAAQSPIITFAHDIRSGKAILKQQNPALHIRDKLLPDDTLVKSSQVICGKNLTRTYLNQRIRRVLGFNTLAPQMGEKLIILKNNQSFGVFNGMIVFVDEIKDTGSTWTMTFHDEVGNTYRRITIWKAPFLQDGKLKQGQYCTRHEVHADFGYVITCHKSQGSEWDMVTVIHEFVPPQIWDMKRWSYTAITRAAKQLTYAI